MRKCINCKSECRDDDLYCRNCGFSRKKSFYYILINSLIFVSVFSIILVIGLIFIVIFK